MAELTIYQALQKGIEAHNIGQVQEAARLYTVVLKAQPNHPEANHSMGVLAVDCGNVEQALPFFKQALEANPAIAQFWLSYIDTLMKLDKLEDAKAVLDQAKSKGAMGDGFDELAQRLKGGAQVEPLESANTAPEEGQEQLNVLDRLSLDQAIKLAKKKAKAGSTEEAKNIYWDILTKFPKNQRASNGLKDLSARPDEKVSKAKDPPQDQLQALNDIYKKAQLARVVEHAEILTQRYPDAFAVWNLMGAAAAQMGQHDRAMFSFKKVLAIKPDYAEAYNNIGNVLKEQGKLDDAIDAYNKALVIKPDYVDAYKNMGVTLKSQGKLEEAIETYNKALAIKPDYAEAYNNMGNALKDQFKLDEAIKAYDKALAIKPVYAEAHNNKANALKDQGNLDDAIKAYHKALAIKPDYVDAYNNMGVTLKLQGKLEEAIEVCKKALAIKPHYAEAYNTMGNALNDQFKLDEAIKAYNKALAIKPDYAEAYNNMGVALKHLGKLEEAIEACKKALTIKPEYAEAHHNLSFAFLNSGKLKEGLDEYEWRWKTKEGVTRKRQFSKPMWDGTENLKGKKILLWCEQGVGDTINWSSTVPLIVSQAEHCVLECQKKLVPLLARSFPNVEVKAENRSQDPHRNDFDFHLPMGSLYRNYTSEIFENAKPDAFLVPDPSRIKFWRKRLECLGNGPFIGVSWKSAVMSPTRLPNYAPISDWSPIFTIPNVTFINLQYIDFLDDLTQIENEFGVTVYNFDDLDHYDDLDDVAALCAALDIVVSTKVTVPLISAGVGTITKLASWRQSSWNNLLLDPVGPFVDIFEKSTLEPWRKVFREVAEDITKSLIMSNRTSGSCSGE